MAHIKVASVKVFTIATVRLEVTANVVLSMLQFQVFSLLLFGKSI